jgi:hypothetical protein
MSETNPTPVPATLSQRMLAVFSELGPVGRHGLNSHHGYRFATESDIKQHLRPVLAKHGLYVTATSVGDPIVEWIQLDQDRRALFARVQASIAVVCGETDERHYTDVWGAAVDRDDKALNKALQAAVKYGLIAMFMLATCDEEADEVSPVTEGADSSPAAPVRSSPATGGGGQAPPPARVNSANASQPPTQAQMRYLERLAAEKAVTVPNPQTKQEASAEIERLKNMPAHEPDLLDAEEDVPF